MPRKPNHPIYGVFYRARNKAGFHFDADAFTGAIRALNDRFSTTERARSSFVVEGSGGRLRRIYYSVADHVAAEATLGVSKPDERPSNHEALRAAMDLHDALGRFIDAAFEAYCKMRHLPITAFRRENLSV